MPEKLFLDAVNIARPQRDNRQQHITRELGNVTAAVGEKPRSDVTNNGKLFCVVWLLEVAHEHRQFLDDGVANTVGLVLRHLLEDREHEGAAQLGLDVGGERAAALGDEDAALSVLVSDLLPDLGEKFGFDALGAD